MGKTSRPRKRRRWTGPRAAAFRAETPPTPRSQRVASSSSCSRRLMAAPNKASVQVRSRRCASTGSSTTTSRRAPGSAAAYRQHQHPGQDGVDEGAQLAVGWRGLEARGGGKEAADLAVAQLQAHRQLSSGQGGRAAASRRGKHPAYVHFFARVAARASATIRARARGETARCARSCYSPKCTPTPPPSSARVVASSTSKRASASMKYRGVT